MTMCSCIACPLCDVVERSLHTYLLLRVRALVGEETDGTKGSGVES